MKVKTLKPHQNRYGDKFEKVKGDEYSLPDGEAEMLARRKIVKAMSDDVTLNPAPPPPQK